MISPLFRFFEAIAEELTASPSVVINRDVWQVSGEDVALLDDLKLEMEANSTSEAIGKAVARLTEHFAGKCAAVPFNYDPSRGRFEATDQAFLEFVATNGGMRSVGTCSRDFEVGVMKRLGACPSIADWVLENKQRWAKMLCGQDVPHLSSGTIAAASAEPAELAAR